MRSDIDDVYAFWKRIDDANKGSLKDLCKASGVDYAKVRQNRTAMRYMSCMETLAFAQALNVSIEYLLVGKEPRLSPRIQAIVDWLGEDEQRIGSLELLLFGGKAGKSSGRRMEA